MTVSIHQKIKSNVSIAAWKHAPEKTKKQRIVKQLMISRAILKKSGAVIE